MNDATSPPYTIPRATIDRWLALPPDGYLAVRMTRRDLDHFFQSFDKLLFAQAQFQQAMIVWTNGQTDVANNLSENANRSLEAAQNNFRQFFGALMASAERVE